MRLKVKQCKRQVVVNGSVEGNTVVIGMVIYCRENSGLELLLRASPWPSYSQKSGRLFSEEEDLIFCEGKTN